MTGLKVNLLPYMVTVLIDLNLPNAICRCQAAEMRRLLQTSWQLLDRGSCRIGRIHSGWTALLSSHFGRQ